VANHGSIGRITSRDEVHGMSFSPDSRMLYIASGVGVRLMLQEHMLRTDDLVSELCRRVTRQLTPAEWVRYVGGAPYKKTCEALQ
jgi:hypothetical protein